MCLGRQLYQQTKRQSLNYHLDFHDDGDGNASHPTYTHINNHTTGVPSQSWSWVGVGPVTGQEAGGVKKNKMSFSCDIFKGVFNQQTKVSLWEMSTQNKIDSLPYVQDINSLASTERIVWSASGSLGYRLNKKENKKLKRKWLDLISWIYNQFPIALTDYATIKFTRKWRHHIG